MQQPEAQQPADWRQYVNDLVHRQFQQLQQELAAGQATIPQAARPLSAASHSTQLELALQDQRVEEDPGQPQAVPPQPTGEMCKQLVEEASWQRPQAAAATPDSRPCNIAPGS